MEELPAWLETLYNVDKRIAKRAEAYIKEMAKHLDDKCNFDYLNETFE